MSQTFRHRVGSCLDGCACWCAYQVRLEITTLRFNHLPSTHQIEQLLFDVQDAKEDIPTAGLKLREDDAVVMESSIFSSVKVSLVNAKLILGFAHKNNTMFCKFLATNE